MVIVLEKLTAGQEIEEKRIFRSIVVVEILITVFVAAPVYNGAVYRTHQEMNWQQQVQIPHIGGYKRYINSNVNQAPAYTAIIGIAKVFQFVP